uniref:MBL fold metallo-hydrolase n=1 Tax=candidate division WOR-3 bacterium TaxID=2052148 RepID=A0A7V0Z4E0_UNCW3
MSRKVKESAKDEIIFLGTGGARFVIAKQLRATGGIFFRIGGKNILVDPGPESYYRFLTYLPKFNPEKIDAIILTHKHIDHSGDINVYLDVLTQGGFKKNGFLVAPGDAFGKGGVIFEYLLDFLKEVKIIKPGLEIEFDSLKFQFPIRHEHRVETYGFKLIHNNYSVSYIVDTKFFSELVNAYRSDIIILSLLKLESSEIDHLSVEDCKEIIIGIKPKVAIITHFGMTIIRNGPWNVARQLKEKTGITVLAAEDGRHYEIEKLLSYE